MKSKLTDFCSFTLCVRPILNFGVKSVGRKDAHHLLKAHQMVWQHAGAFMEPLYSCSGLKCISPNSILNISKPSRVLKVSECLKKKTNKVYFLFNEANHFWLNIWCWCMVGSIRIWRCYRLLRFVSKKQSTRSTRLEGKFQILKLLTCKKWRIFKFFKSMLRKESTCIVQH